MFGFDTEADIELTSGSRLVLLPIDYKLASKNQLLNVIYPNTLGNFFSAITVGSTRLPGLKRPPSSNSSLESPQFQNKLLYGVSRKYLVLPVEATSSETRTLSYKANFRIEDGRWEVLVKELPSEADTLTITVKKQDQENTVIEKLYAFGDDVVIGSNQHSTANNLEKVINSDTNETGILATVNGWIVSIAGDKEDVDISVTTNSRALQCSYIDALDNTDSNVSNRVQRYLEGQYKLYVSTRTKDSTIASQLASQGTHLLELATKGLN